VSTSVEREEDLPSTPWLERDADALLACLDLESAELSVLLCGDHRIAVLNAEWRGSQAPTDVLSFPQDDEVVLGDLVISVEMAVKQAQERSHGLQDELRILLVHGLLHLLGYDHERDRDSHDEMAAREGEVMKSLGWRGAGLIERSFEQAEHEGAH